MCKYQLVGLIISAEITMRWPQVGNPPQVPRRHSLKSVKTHHNFPIVHHYTAGSKSTRVDHDQHQCNRSRLRCRIQREYCSIGQLLFSEYSLLKKKTLVTLFNQTQSGFLTFNFSLGAPRSLIDESLPIRLPF